MRKNAEKMQKILIDFRRNFSNFERWEQDHDVFWRFPKKKFKNSLIGLRNDFSKIAIFSIVFVTGNKTIETCFDHKSAKSAIRSILQKATPFAWSPLQEKQVKSLPHPFEGMKHETWNVFHFESNEN